MSELEKPDNWLDRKPLPGETCVFSHGYDGLNRTGTNSHVAEWKRDALLFDKVFASCSDPNNPPDIPIELSFGIEKVDSDVRSYDVSMGQMVAQAYAGMTNEEVNAQLTKDGLDAAFDFDAKLAASYSMAGVMAEWTYASSGSYLRRFNTGERIAYEGALNNIPIVSVQAASWDHIIEFRADPEAVRKYRDLRLWLRSGLQAQSANHATDIIGQKIENYQWAIKKHGFQTAIGGFKQIFDWKESRLMVSAVGVAGAVGGPVWATIAGGLAVAAQVGAFLCERKLSSSDVMRGPDSEVAILYDIQVKFGK